MPPAVDIVLGPAARQVLHDLPGPHRALATSLLLRLGEPARFLAMKPIVGRGPAWRSAEIGPFLAQCRLMTAQEVAACRAREPALLVADLVRRDKLREDGEDLSRGAE